MTLYPLTARLPATPRWLRQGLIVLSATVGMMAAFGASTTIAVLLKPLETEFGWFRADISMAYAKFSVGVALGGVVAGWALDRADTRLIVGFGALAIAIGLMALSGADDLNTIQFIYLAIGTLGFACLYAPLITTVGLWFDRGRGLAMGIVTAGGTIGQGITPLIVQPIVAAAGWRNACLALGIGCLLVLVPVMLTVTKPPERESMPRAVASQRPEGWRLPPFVSVSWLGLAALFCCASMAIPVVHLIALFADRGEPPAVSGSLILTVMLSASLGRVTIGAICDRIGSLRGYAIAVLIQTVTVHWFVELKSLSALYALAVVFGFGYGGVMTTLNLCVREAVPARMAGFATAIVAMTAWAGMGFGGYHGGYCYDATGTYVASFASAALAGIANLIVVAGLALHLRWHDRIAQFGPWKRFGAIALAWAREPGSPLRRRNGLKRL